MKRGRHRDRQPLSREQADIISIVVATFFAIAVLAILFSNQF